MNTEYTKEQIEKVIEEPDILDHLKEYKIEDFFDTESPESPYVALTNKMLEVCSIPTLCNLMLAYGYIATIAKREGEPMLELDRFLSFYYKLFSMGLTLTDLDKLGIFVDSE